MQNKKLLYRVISFWTIVFVIVLGYFFIYKGKDFKYGLDLNGGVSLTYIADITKAKNATTTGYGISNINEAMDGLREIIEKRVNLFGVAEPIVRTDYSRYTGEHRLIVELPGITNIDEAIKKIGDTPVLEFKLIDIKTDTKTGATSSILLDTGITGELLKKSQLQFDQTTNKPIVSLNFNEKGTDLFAKLTKENIGKQIAIYLDGNEISSPVINEAILNGQAIISGSFTVEEAKHLVQRLNSGALPIPVKLASSQTIDATLGAEAKENGLKAGIIGFILIIIAMIIWYRLPGLIASIALFSYIILVLSIFKLIPITLTAAGIAGFIISLGIAIDANILIFERMKEEMKSGKSISKSIEEGYNRAWTSIRDSNLASIIVATILFYFGSSIISGFALAFAIGVSMSMFTVMFISKYLLRAIATESDSKIKKFLFLSGFNR